MVKVVVVKFFRILLCLAFALGTILAAGQAQAQDEASTELKPPEIIGEYAPGELLVKFKPGIPSSKIEETEKNLSASTLKTIPQIDVRVMGIPEGKSVPEMVDAFSKLPWVEYAEPNYRRYKVVTPDDTYFSSQWALSQVSDHDIDAPEGWDITTGNASIIIAVIDDGIDYNHEEFPSGKLWINPSTEKPGYDFGQTDDDVIHRPGSGHGTATAGIAAAATNNGKGIAGVSWASVIMPLKVEDGSGFIYDSYIANAITFATDNGAHILSMSLGGPSSSSTLENACQYAWENGKVVVASSGNENTAISYPARYPTTIAVGATNEIDNRIYPGNPGDEWSSGGSNYGPELDVVAPGINIYATDWSAPGKGYNPTGAYVPNFGGTSASCPFVSGEAALLLAKDSSLSNERVRSIIRSSAEDEVGESLEDTQGFDIYYGYGRINLYNALSSPTKPDLTLNSSDITFSNDSPSPGETITISATIHNNGRDYSEISAINIGSQSEGAAPATADSYQGTYYPENANDGDDSTAWASQYRTGWVKIDLTTEKMIGRVYWDDALFVSDNQPGEFTIEVSTDDVSYTTIDTVTGYTGSSYIKILDTPFQARYVRMTMTARTAGYAATLCELGVYEVYYDTVVRFYDGDPGGGGTQIGSDQHLSPIAASGAETASVQWTATSGSHDIYVVVDPDNLIPESNETNNQAYKSLSVGPAEVISFTVTDYGSAGVKFGTLDPGIENQPTDQTPTQGAVTLTVGNETNVNVGIYLKGDDFSDGSHTLAVSNVTYDDDGTLDEASETGLTQGAMATTYGTAWDTVTAGTGAIIQVYHWISIPGGQVAGTYTSTFYYQAIKSGG